MGVDYDIANEVWKSLSNDMDIASALQEMLYLQGGICALDKGLIRAFDEKIQEQSDEHELSNCCFAPMETKVREEVHWWLDDRPVEKIYSYHCSSCGNELF